MRLFFFHGLNTFGDDLVHIGPFKLGSMHERWQVRLSERHPQIEFIPVQALGSGSLDQQVDRALHELRDLLGPQPSSATFHFLGQSTGGLIARQIAHHPDFRSRVKSVITVGTPHHGAKAAEYALQISQRTKWFKNFLRIAGYDLDERQKIFHDLTPAALEEFNRRFDHKNAAPCYPLICSVPRAQVAWPLQFFYTSIHHRGPSGSWNESDGFVSVESQILTPQIGADSAFLQEKFHLDHFGELGYFPPTLEGISEASAKRGVKEFDRLLDVTARIVSTRNV